MDNRLQLIIEAQNRASEQLRKIASDVESMGKSSAENAGKMAKAFDLAKGGLGGLAVGAIAYKAIDIGKEFAAAGLAAERMAIGLQSALGSLDAAAGAEKYLRAESERLGLAFTDQIKSYVSLSAAAKGTALEGENTRKIFSAVAEASVALGLRTEETSGALVAIQQMMSKGTVSAEELRGQLGERLPGAFNLAARAMGVTTQGLGKMLEQGEIVAADFLPKLAKVLSDEYGPAAARAADSTQAAVTRMNNAWEEAKRAIGERLLPYMAWAAEQINKTIQTIIPSTLEAKAKALESEISSLKKQISQPFFFGGDKDRLKQLEGELVSVQREISGVGNKTGEWAKGAVALQESLKDQTSMVKNVTDASQVFSQSDFMQGRNRRGLDQLQLYVDQTKQHEKALKGATEKARNYFDTVKDVASMNTGALSSDIDAYKSLADEWAKLTLSAAEYQKLALDMWFAREAEKVGTDNEMLLKLYETKKLILQVNEAYNQAPLKEDPWIKHYKKKEELAADTEKTIAETTKKEQDDLAKSIDKLWENTWQNLQKTYSDIIYDMLSGDLSTWDDYFQSIKKLFLRLIAEMTALWSVDFIKGIFSGSASGGLASFFGNGEEGSSGAAGIAGAAGLAGALGGLKNAAAAVTDWLGLTSVAADSMAVATTHAATSATGAAAAIKAYEAGLSGAASNTNLVANGMYEFGTGATSATAGILAMTGALIPLGAALGGMMGLDEVLFGGDRQSAYDVLHEWAAGIRDLTAAEEAYYKAAYISDFTGVDPQAMKESIALQEQYSGYLTLTVQEMDALVQKRAELDIALRQEAGLLDWFNTALVEKSAETIKFEMEELLATFSLEPSDEWYRLKIPVDTSSMQNMNGMASGGPVSAGVPYVVGEIGPELFVPQQSGHILSHENMRRLLAMGVKGFAAGTTDLASWESDYSRYVNSELGLISDFGEALLDLMDKFQSLIAEAEELGKTSEEIAAMYEDWAKIAQKIVDDTVDDIMSRARELSRSEPATIDEQLAQDIQDITDEFYEMWRQLEELSAAGYDMSGQMSELYNEWVRAAQNAVQKVRDTILAKFDDINESIKQYNWQIANPGGTTSGYYQAELGSLYSSMLSGGATLEGLSNAADLLAAWYNAAVSEAESKASSVSSASDSAANALDSAASALADFVESIDDLIRDIKYSSFNLALPAQKLQEAQLDYDTLRAAAFSAGSTREDLETFRDFAKTYLQAGQDNYKSSTAYQEIYTRVMADLDLLKTTAKLSAFESQMLTETKSTTSYARQSSADLSSINSAFQRAQKILEEMLGEISGMGTSGETGTSPGWDPAEAGNRYYTTSSGKLVYDTWSYLGRTPGELLGQIALSSYRTSYNTAQLCKALDTVGVYGDGGVVLGPQLSVVGEKGPEAIIPMKNGAIPVHITGSGSVAGSGGNKLESLLQAVLVAINKRQHVTLRLEDGRELRGFIRATADELDQARVDRNIRSRVYY